MGDDKNEQANKTDANKGQNVNVDDKNETPGNETKKDPGQMIPKSRFDQVNTEKKQAVEALQKVADSMIEDIPEDFRDLVPKGLQPADQINWIRSASAKGIFNPKDVNSPDPKRPASKNKQSVNLEDKTPEEMIDLGVGEDVLKGVEI
jgi:hypothetical protein